MRGTVHVQGIITAQIEQECVTSFKPVITDIKEDFDTWFADADTVISFVKAQQEKTAQGGEQPILPEQDDPEAIIDGKIDLGELIIQFLSLAIPPYPHADGVDPVGDDPESAKPQNGSGHKNPFAALKDWKDKQR